MGGGQGTITQKITEKISTEVVNTVKNKLEMHVKNAFNLDIRSDKVIEISQEVIAENGSSISNISMQSLANINSVFGFQNEVQSMFDQLMDQVGKQQAQQKAEAALKAASDIKTDGILNVAFTETNQSIDITMAAKVLNDIISETCASVVNQVAVKVKQGEAIRIKQLVRAMGDSSVKNISMNAVVTIEFKLDQSSSTKSFVQMIQKAVNETSLDIGATGESDAENKFTATTFGWLTTIIGVIGAVVIAAIIGFVVIIGKLSSKWGLIIMAVVVALVVISIIIGFVADAANKAKAEEEEKKKEDDKKKESFTSSKRSLRQISIEGLIEKNNGKGKPAWYEGQSGKEQRIMDFIQREYQK